MESPSSLEAGEKRVRRQDRELSVECILDLIAEGKKIVLYEGMVLQLDGWMAKHPGGDLVILHMVGRDATDEINVYHSTESKARMPAFSIGKLAQNAVWTNVQPDIQMAKHQLTGLPEGTTQLIPEVRITVDNTTHNEKATSTCTSTSTDTANLSCTGSPTRDLSRCSSRTSWTNKADFEESHLSTGGLLPVKQTRAEYTYLAEQSEIDRDLELFPSLDAATQNAIVARYRQLHEDIKAAGLYECRYIEYAKESVRYSILFACFAGLLYNQWYLTSSLFLGLWWHQIMFVAHDAGHMGITHNFVVDSLIGIFIADFCCGLSIGWWKRSHNVHHLVTNHPEHDPDIQNVPLLATSPSFFRSIYSSYYSFRFLWDSVADIVVPYQHLTYYPIMMVARFNLYLLSWLHLINIKMPSLGVARWTRTAEIASMACYWYIFGYRLLWCYLPDWPTRIIFVLLSHFITFPLHIQITLSHFAMSTADLGPAESFPQKMLRTTMDVDCPSYFDWVHGGLQFQAVHHLFPRVPRHNLRMVQSHVRKFCEEVGIKYEIYGFVDGNKKVLGRLEEVGKMVGVLRECHKVMVEKGVVGHHH